MLLWKKNKHQRNFDEYETTALDKIFILDNNTTSCSETVHNVAKKQNEAKKWQVSKSYIWQSNNLTEGHWEDVVPECDDDSFEPRPKMFFNVVLNIDPTWRQPWDQHCSDLDRCGQSLNIYFWKKKTFMA